MSTLIVITRCGVYMKRVKSEFMLSFNRLHMTS